MASKLAWASSADKSAGEATLVIAFYNIGWMTSRFNQIKKHKKTLSADLRDAIDKHEADMIFLCECGEVGKGLAEEQWLEMLRRICGPGFVVKHQSHYTSIVKQTTMKVTKEPTLQGPLTPLRHHEYRKCQYLQVRAKK